MSPVAAQAPAQKSTEELTKDTDWTRVRSLRTGTKIVVTARTSPADTYAFLAADDARLTLGIGGHQHTVMARSDVLEIRYPETHYAKAGMLIGLAAGIAIGTQCGPTGPTNRPTADAMARGDCFLRASGIGLGLGAAVGSVFNARSHELELIYHAGSAGPSEPRVRLSTTR
jgi:hypothetical protein